MGAGQPDLLLVVDDSDEMRALLRQQLADRGYEVVTAADGEQALELVSRRRPDAILLDHELLPRAAAATELPVPLREWMLAQAA